MEFKRITGQTEIPVIGLGTWRLGRDVEADTTHDKKHISAIKTAIQLGIIHIDTAESYAKGHTEELIGEAIQGFDRSGLFITSKVSPEEMVGTKVDDIYVDPEDKWRLIKRLEKYGVWKNFLSFCKKKNGERFYTERTTHLIRDKDGTPVLIEGIIKVIPERKKGIVK